MSSKHVVMATSALPEKMRTNILIADLLRIMRCVSPHCEPAERTKHVQHYMHRMQFSGYCQKQRVAVYRAAKKKYNQQFASNEEGTVPLYRSKQWNRTERNKAKRLKKRNWCGKTDATFFVDATPGSQLSKQFQNVFRKCNLNVRVIERSGRTIKQMLTKSNPFQKSTCECLVCSASGKSICGVRDSVYEISCSVCCHKYIGETSRSLKERYTEHMMLYKRKVQSSVLFQHVQEKHPIDSERVVWKVKILKRCPGDPSLRQATEATYIRNTKPELNRKCEFGDSNRPRVGTTAVPIM